MDIFDAPYLPEPWADDNAPPKFLDAPTVEPSGESGIIRLVNRLKLYFNTSLLVLE